MTGQDMSKLAKIAGVIEFPHQAGRFKREPFSEPAYDHRGVKREYRQITPGMEGSVSFGSDTYPLVVIGHRLNGLRVLVQRASYRHDPDREGGIGHQNWICEANPNGAYDEFTWRRNEGLYRLKGKGDRQARLCLNGFRAYYDWSF